MQPRGVIAIKSFRVELLHHSETAELAFVAVPIALVVSIFGRELAAGDLVDHLDPGNDLDRKGQPRLPAGLWLLFVFQIETSRGGVLYQCAGAGVVVPFLEQVRLQPAGKVQKLVGTVAKSPEIISPEDALCTAAEHIDETNRIEIGNRRC